MVDTKKTEDWAAMMEDVTRAEHFLQDARDNLISFSCVESLRFLERALSSARHAVVMLQTLHTAVKA